MRFFIPTLELLFIATIIALFVVSDRTSSFQELHGYDPYYGRYDLISFDSYNWYHAMTCPNGQVVLIEASSFGRSIKREHKK